MTYNITAWSNIENRRVHLFRWNRDGISGCIRAEEEAKKFGRDKELSDYQAERVGS
jgi:hypothetical protein